MSNKRTPNPVNNTACPEISSIVAFPVSTIGIRVGVEDVSERMIVGLGYVFVDVASS